MVGCLRMYLSFALLVCLLILTYNTCLLVLVLRVPSFPAIKNHVCAASKVHRNLNGLRHNDHLRWGDLHKSLEHKQHLLRAAEDDLSSTSSHLTLFLEGAVLRGIVSTAVDACGGCMWQCASSTARIALNRPLSHCPVMKGGFCESGTWED